MLLTRATASSPYSRYPLRAGTATAPAPRRTATPWLRHRWPAPTRQSAHRDSTGRSTDDRPAVHGDDHASGVGGFGAGQLDDPEGHLLRLADPSERDVCD